MYSSQPAWSFQKKYKVAKPLLTPSPSTYQPNATNSLSKSPSWKIGKQLRNVQKTQHFPGPETYIPHDVQKNHKFGIFGTEPRTIKYGKQTPGPGAYIFNQKNSKNSFSMAKKYELINTTIDFPGPGQYQASFIENKKGIKLTRQRRFQTEKNQVDPGPGRYQAVRPTSASVSFTKAQRMSKKLLRPESAIGPGKYETKSLFEANLANQKGSSLGKKFKQSKVIQIPGPASYSPTRCDFPSSPSLTLGRKFKEHDLNRSPSPDQYRPQYKDVFCKTQSYSIGKAERQNLYEQKHTPGPGTYLNQQFSKTSKNITLKGMRSPDKIQNFPGPGSYDPQQKIRQKRPQSAKIGNAKRFNLQTPTGPSPGTYEQVLQAFSPKYSFTKKKKNITKKDDTPGPGNYHIPSTISNLQAYNTFN